MMRVLATLVKENSAGNSLKAVILERETGLSIKYYVNDTYKHEEIFDNKQLFYVERVANNWLSEVGTLNG
jgi:hypothetical protein